MNRHHIIYKSANDKRFRSENPQRTSYDIHDKRNIILLDEQFHQAFHFVFQEQRTPKEQMELLTRINETVLSRYTKELLQELQATSDKDFYSFGIAKGNKRG